MAAKKSGKKSGAKSKAKTKALGVRLISSLVLFAVLCGVFLVSLVLEDKIDESLGLRKVETYQKGDMVAIGAMNIHFMDVGQGDSCLIELPDNKSVLIDAGGGSTDSSNKAAADKIKSYISQINRERTAADRPQIDYFDYVIATHSDADHIGGMAYVLEDYPAAVFYRPNEEATNSGFYDPALSAALEEDSLPKNTFWTEGQGKKDTVTYKKAIEAGYRNHDRFIEGIVTNPFDDSQNCIKPDPSGLSTLAIHSNPSTKLDPSSPSGSSDSSNPFDASDTSTSSDPSDPSDMSGALEAGGGLYYELNFYGPVSATYSDHNNYSPIIIAEYKGRRIALSGDCEKKGESDFVEMVNASTAGDRFYTFKSGDFYADIIKLGHHGSETSTGSAYLSIMTKPRYASEIYAVISCGKNNQYKHPHESALNRTRDAGITDQNILRTDEDGDIFFALNFYEGVQRAFVERDRADVLTIATYPVKVLGIEIRYRLIGTVLIIILALVILPSGFTRKNGKFLKRKQ